jgi:hypothetical protein
MIKKRIYSTFKPNEVLLNPVYTLKGINTPSIAMHQTKLSLFSCNRGGRLEREGEREKKCFTAKNI